MAVKLKPNHLLIIHDDQGSKEFVLEAAQYSVGRDTKCHIRLISHFVSRYHANLVRIDREDGSYYYRIVDGDGRGRRSANGLLINGRSTLAHDLTNEDEVIFGPAVRAVYYSLDRSTFPSDLIDEMDVTLINPGSRPDVEAELD